MSIGRFYGMVGALVRRESDGRYLMLKRSPEKDFGSGAWECVTGRVDQGEGFEEAVHREVSEELGCEVTIDFIVGTAHFYRGEAKAENEMIGLQFCCTTKTEKELKVSWEHSEYQWVNVQEAQQMLPEGYWLVDVMRRADTIRELMSDELAAYYRDTVFGGAKGGV